MAQTMGHNLVRRMVAEKFEFAAEARYKADRKAILPEELIPLEEEDVKAEPFEILNPVFGRMVDGVFHSF